jgi:two-component system, LuxR family, response regulator FixJ
MTPHQTVTTETVCLVDDDPAVLKSVSRLLASDGLPVRAFNEPEDFLVYIQAHRVPVAIIDVWMPAMNGLEVQSRLRAISPSTRVIIFTGKEDPLVRSAALKAGAAAFFIKPFEDDAFLAAIRSALALST